MAAIEEAVEVEIEADPVTEAGVVVTEADPEKEEVEIEDHLVKFKEEQSHYGKIQVLDSSDLATEVKIYLSIPVDLPMVTC